MSGVFSRRGSPPKPPAPPPVEAAEPDPSMEDILASIRRILNDGETEGDATAAAAAAVPEAGQNAPEPASVAGAAPAKGEEVFILDSAMMVAENAPAAEMTEDANIASTETLNAASQSVGALKKALSERQATIYRGTAVSLEEIVREEVRPMLKGWLDANLPAVVERLVRAEIERVVAREIM
jgi:cell pole-organizing protein PopZ